MKNVNILKKFGQAIIVVVILLLPIQTGSAQCYEYVDKQKWENKGWFNLMQIGDFSGNAEGSRWDMLFFRFNCINIGISSWFELGPISNFFRGSLPHDQARGLVMLLPFGYYRSIIAKKHFTLGFNSLFYLLPTSAWESDDCDYKLPRLLEIGLKFDTYCLSISAGYRHQFGKWEEAYDYLEDWNEVGRLDGLFVEASVGLSIPITEFEENVKIMKYLPKPNLEIQYEMKNYTLYSGKQEILDVRIVNKGRGPSKGLNLYYKVIGDGQQCLTIHNDTNIYKENLTSNSQLDYQYKIRAIPNIAKTLQTELILTCTDDCGSYVDCLIPITIKPKIDWENPPNLKIEKLFFSENVLGALKKVSLIITVKNIGQGDANETCVELTSNVPGLFFPQKSTIGKIDKYGGIQTINIPVEADINLLDGEVTLSGFIEEPNYRIKIPFTTIPIKTKAFKSPNLILANHYAIETAKLDGKININEDFDLTLQIKNTGEGLAEFVKVSIENNQPGVIFQGSVEGNKISKTMPTFPKIEPGQYEIITLRYRLTSDFFDKYPKFKVTAKERFDKYGFTNQTVDFAINKEIVSIPIPLPKRDVQLPIVSPDYPDVTNPVKSGSIRKNAIAIIIGMPDAKNAFNDTELMRIYFGDVFGIPEDRIRVIPESQLNRKDFIIYFTDILPNSVNSQTEIFIYYSGHIVFDNDNNTYILPKDGRYNNEVVKKYVPDLCYSLTAFYESLYKLNAKHTTVIIDACFSGFDKSDNILYADVLWKKGQSRPKINEAFRQYKNFTLITSSSKNQASWAMKDGEYSLFTLYFTAGLKGLADVNKKDGGITFREIMDYAIPNVEAQSEKYGEVQTPSFWTSDGDFNKIIIKY